MTVFVLRPDANARDRMAAAWRFACQFLEVGKAVRVTVREAKPTRTLEQNALLFGGIYPPIAEAMGYTVEDVHEYMLGRHFGWVDRKVPKTPRNPEGVESVPFRTTTRDENGKRDVLKKDQFSKFLDTVERIAAQAGVFVSREAA
jgi:hypothetical protein